MAGSRPARRSTSYRRSGSGSRRGRERSQPSVVPIRQWHGLTFKVVMAVHQELNVTVRDMGMTTRVRKVLVDEQRWRKRRLVERTIPRPARYLNIVAIATPRTVEYVHPIPHSVNLV